MTAQPTVAEILRRATGPLVVFEIALDLAVLVVLDPLLVLLLDRIVALGGDPFVGNSALVAFALSPAGMLALATAAVGVIFANIVACGGTSLVLWDARQSLPVRQLAVWRALFLHSPALLTISAWAFATAFLLVVPVLATAIAARQWWLAGGDFYFYFATRPAEFLWAAIAVGVVAAAAATTGLCIVLRTGLAVPLCLLCPVGASRALRLAVRATRGRARALLVNLLGAVLGLVAIWVAFAFVFAVLLNRLIAWRMSDTALHRTGLLVVVGAAVALPALVAISRGVVLFVLLRDPSADALLPVRPEPEPVRRHGVRLAALLALCALLPAGALVSATRAGEASRRAIAITAHRAGSARAPENTLAALRQAIADGADVIEIDAQETADGKVVVLHDTDLRRVAGVARPIWEMRADEVARLDAGSWFAPGFRGERIPTLRTFATASRGRVRLNVELKDNGHGEDLAARAIAVLREAGVADHASISSLDLGLLREVRRIAPEIKVGLILATGVGDLHGVSVDFLALSRRLATPAVIRDLVSRGREVHVWTLDDDASMARAMLDGADNIITGDTRRAVRMRDWFRRLSPPEKVLLRVADTFSTLWFRLAARPAGSAAAKSAPEEP
jgi:glycerophosphoryl diester phosphodiesterase